MRMKLVRPLVLALAGALIAAACGSSKSSSSGESKPPASQLQAVVANFDLTTGSPSRLLIGLQMGDQRLVGFGSVDVRVHAGDGGKPSGDAHAAHFLAIPGVTVPSPEPAQPQLVDAAHGRGVYTTTVTFDQPGVWTADVDTTIDGVGHVTASTQFNVGDKHAAIAVGDKAIASETLTVAAPGGAPLSAVDSRAQNGAAVPDPELHSTTIAAALAAHQPLVVVFSTPVYCQSRFCGPITDLVGDLAKQDAGKAAFVHVEIYKNFDSSELNDAVAPWLQRFPGADIGEPWVFVIGRDGIVKARFDNVVTRDELVGAIDAVIAP